VAQGAGPGEAVGGFVVFLFTFFTCVVAVTSCARASPGSGAATRGEQETPIIIGHRGASGYRPEHTLAAYELAIRQGADFIEPDVVITKDGVLVARHEHRLDETTDVAERFPSLRTVKRIANDTATGWFVEDLTLAQLRTLRARERLPSRSHAYDGQFGVPTLDEVLALAVRMSGETGRVIGVYPETKSPSYFRSIGLPLEETLIAALQRHWPDLAQAPVFVQSFEVENLKRLRAMTPVRLIQLLDAEGGPADASDTTTYATMASAAGLRGIARYAHGVGVNKRLIIAVAPDGRLLTPTSVVADAHAAGLLVHVWTFRSDTPFLAAAYGGDPAAEYRQFAALGIDAVFSDFPDHAAAALRRR
jgi:glycerophosphoryl diester phosphodiesterase